MIERKSGESRISSNGVKSKGERRAGRWVEKGDMRGSRFDFL